MCNGDTLSDRTSLLQFALTHCPPSEVKKILQLLRTVETEDVYQQCTATSDTVSKGALNGIVIYHQYSSHPLVECCREWWGIAQ